MRFERLVKRDACASAPAAYVNGRRPTPIRSSAVSVASPLHVILASVGTDGDVFPYVGLGVALRRRGHRATLVAAEDYRALAESSGLSFVPLVTREENDACFGHPDFWHPLKGAFVAARWGGGLMPRQYELFAGLARDARSVFVASPGLLTVRMVQEKLGRPLASVVLQPWMIPSCTDPPVMPLGLTLPRWAPRPLGRLYWRGLDLVPTLLVGRRLNALRKRVGLPRLSGVFPWWLSPTRVLAMFPAWYGEPQPDWPPQVRLTGFPMYDGAPRRRAGRAAERPALVPRRARRPAGRVHVRDGRAPRDALVPRRRRGVPSARTCAGSC